MTAARVPPALTTLPLAAGSATNLESPLAADSATNPESPSKRPRALDTSKLAEGMLQLAWRVPAAPRLPPIGSRQRPPALRQPTGWRVAARSQDSRLGGQPDGEEQHGEGRECQQGGQPGAAGGEEQLVHIPLPWGRFFAPMSDELQQLRERCELAGDTESLQRVEKMEQRLESTLKAVIGAVWAERRARERGDWQPGPAPAATRRFEQLGDLAAAFELPHDAVAVDRLAAALASEASTCGVCPRGGGLLVEVEVAAGSQAGTGPALPSRCSTKRPLRCAASCWPPFSACLSRRA